MNLLPDGAIQTAFYSTLSGDATLSNMVTGVFDDVPEGTERPYVTVADILSTPDNRHDNFCFQTVVTVHVWSEYRGNSEVMAIGSRVLALLDHTPLTLTGFHHVVTRYEYSQVLKDPGKLELRHMPIRFRVLSELLP